MGRHLGGHSGWGCLLCSKLLWNLHCISALHIITTMYLLLHMARPLICNTSGLYRKRWNYLGIKISSVNTLCSNISHMLFCR